MVLKGDKILFPFKEYEEENRWELIEEIAQKRKKKEGETQGKIKHKGKIYYYKTLVYEGMADGFFILKDTKNSVKYQVLLYMDITIIDQFATYINRGLMVVMENDGESISKEDLPYIFKRFYKGKGGVSDIGLAITKEAVEKMKGKVWVEEAEKMTRFCFLLPRMIK